MRTPSGQVAFYKSLLQKFHRLIRITSPGKYPGRKASAASLAFVQSLSDTWKSLYPYTLVGKMIRFYRANTYGDRDKIAHARVALHTKSQYYAEKLKCVLRELAYFRSAAQTGGMRTLEEESTESTGSVGGTIEEKRKPKDKTWGDLDI